MTVIITYFGSARTRGYADDDEVARMSYNYDHKFSLFVTWPTEAKTFRAAEHHVMSRHCHGIIKNTATKCVDLQCSTIATNGRHCFKLLHF